MSSQESYLINQKVKVPGVRIFLAWLLLVLLPVTGSFWCLDYFLAEYSVFAESEQLSEAFNQLESYKNAQVVENFLSGQLKKLVQIQPLPGKNAETSGINRQISQLTGGRCIMTIFFDQERKRFIADHHRPEDLAGVVFPPASLLKRQLSLLDRRKQIPVKNLEQFHVQSDQKRRNALSLQQLFKTITPVTLQPDQVIKNYSVHFGGDLYFIYCEFLRPTIEIAGFIGILRGKDISNDFLNKEIRQKYPRCRTVAKPMNIQKYETMPAIEYSGIKRLPDRILLTGPADQRYIRHILHGGGVSLLRHENNCMFFNEYHLPLSAMQHPFSEIRPWLKLLAAAILGGSWLLCLHFMLFGVNLAISFKRRILFSTMCAAVFPFVFFAAVFYLHQEYDSFLRKINMLQHVNTRLATVNNELDQYLAWIEDTISIHSQQINAKNINDDAEVIKIFKTIGQHIPVSRMALQRGSGQLALDFPQRSSIETGNDSSEVIEKFFPRKALELLRERPPLQRKRQDHIELPGAVLKVSLIGDSLVANGSFFNIDQSGFPVWLSNTRVTDENLAERPALGLIFSRCEPAPILRAYLKQSAFASEGFSEIFGGYLIRYAFMPVETTGLPFIWRGSGHIHLPQILAAANNQKSETKIIKSRQGDEEILTNRLNNGIPHNAIVLATPMRATTAFSNAFLAAAGSIIYLLTVFYLVNRLLDLFFVRPVMAMAGCAEQIARGSTTWSLQLNTGDELSSLNLSFSRLVTGLQQRNMLKDYLSDDAFSEIADTGTEKLAPGGEYREATIIFAAISDYQKLIAGCSAAESIKILNQYIGIGDQIVRKHGGSIDKILNQTLMLVFRESPAEIGAHALKAAQTVLELAEVTKKQLGTGIYAGISSGTVISGKIGSYQGKLDFTVIGNPVNLAARLKSEAVDSNTGIIISGATMRLLKGKGRVNFLRRCSLKGKAREYNIYELCDLR